MPDTACQMQFVPKPVVRVYNHTQCKAWVSAPCNLLQGTIRSRCVRHTSCHIDVNALITRMRAMICICKHAVRTACDILQHPTSPLEHKSKSVNGQSNSPNRTPGGHTTCHPDDNTLIRKRKWHGMRIRAHAICTACHSLQHPPSPVDASRMHVPCSTLHHHLMHHGCMCLATPFITS